MELNDEMNRKVVDILRIGESDNLHLYAAQLIETLLNQIAMYEDLGSIEEIKGAIEHDCSQCKNNDGTKGKNCACWQGEDMFEWKGM